MKAHLVGGGVASLTAAAYLIRDGGLLGNNIHIYEAAAKVGGSLRGYGDPVNGYVIPVGRMFEKHYYCMQEFLSFIPSVSDPSRSAWNEMEEFHEKHGWNAKLRLVGRDAKVIDSSDFGLTVRDKLAMSRLMLTPENFLDGMKIDEWFTPSFFTSNFWNLWVPVMGTLPQHSLVELKRYFNRFTPLLQDLPHQTKIYRTRFHQAEAIGRPVEDWLRRQGVTFHLDANVTDVDFMPATDRITAQRLKVDFGGEVRTIEIDQRDVVLVTNGTQVADIAVGSNSAAPELKLTNSGWQLWDRLSRGRKDFGNPHVFFGKPESLWVTFAVTASDPAFFDRLESFTGMPTGRQGLITFIESNWYLTIVTFHQPHFIGQPENVMVWWGYGLYPDRQGNFVKKPMRDCTGAEIVEEVLRHLKFDDLRERILAHSNCIPCVLPEANSVWTARRYEDRPPVVPKGSTNFAFIGQYTEIPNDVIFTMEYSMRSAREAVAALLNLDRKPPPPYQGMHDPQALFSALKLLA